MSEESENWFIGLLKARNADAFNNLMIIEGETGEGKSCMGLSILQHLDPYAGGKNIVFTKVEFYEALKRFRSGTIIWDECGVYISHRKWLAEEQISIMQILQSFRYRRLNVIFTLPSAGYMDKVAREMCHFVLHMPHRGLASVYRIMKTPYQSWTYTPFMGTLYSEMPTNMLWDTFTELHDKHIDEFIELSEQKSLVFEKKEKAAIEKVITGKRTIDEDVARGMLILPEIVDLTRDTDQGRINVNELRRLFKERLQTEIGMSRGYWIRDLLLEKLHAGNDQLLNELRKKKEGISFPTSPSTGI